MPEPLALNSNSPRHGLPYLHPGQAQKEFFVNEALARLDALVHAAVIDERAQPPAEPQPGDAYLVASGAAGDWSGEEEAIAVFQGSHWLFQPPVAGASVRMLVSGQTRFYADGWAAATEPAEPTGGATVDAEARAAIAALISAFTPFGNFSRELTGTTGRTPRSYSPNGRNPSYCNRVLPYRGILATVPDNVRLPPNWVKVR